MFVVDNLADSAKYEYALIKCFAAWHWHIKKGKTDNVLANGG